MVDRLRRRTKKSLLDSPWTAAVVGVFALMMFAQAVSAYLRDKSLDRERAELLQAIEDRRQEISGLEERLDKVKSGEGLEIEARSRLNLRKKGEEVLIILDDESPGSEPQADESFMSRVRSWFGIGEQQ